MCIIHVVECRLRHWCVHYQLRVTELARGETDSRLTDVNSELERQRNDCDTLRDKLRQRQVTLVSFFTDRNCTCKQCKTCYWGRIAPLQLTTTTTPFYGPFSGTTRVSRCQKKPLDFLVQGKINRGRRRPSGWVPLHPDQPVLTSTIPPLFLTGRMPFLPFNQQCQSTEGLAHSD